MAFEDATPKDQDFSTFQSNAAIERFVNPRCKIICIMKEEFAIFTWRTSFALLPSGFPCQFSRSSILGKYFPLNVFARIAVGCPFVFCASWKAWIQKLSVTLNFSYSQLRFPSTCISLSCAQTLANSSTSWPSTTNALKPKASSLFR